MKALPWGFIGFAIGIAAGFAYGQTAKSRIGEAVSTGVNGGVIRVEVDTIRAAAAGLPAFARHYVDSQR